MKSGSQSFIKRWLISTAAVLVATYVIPGIDYSSWIHLLGATLLLGILNTFVRPILLVLSLPILILTLGLFMIVINALLLMFVSWIMKPNFHVAGFWSAFFGALVISIITLLLNSMTGSGDSQVEVKRGQAPQPARRDDDGGGPIIDV